MLSTIIKISILVAVIGLFGGVLLQAVQAIVFAISSTFDMWSSVNLILQEFWGWMPSLLQTIIILSFALPLISLLMSVNYGKADQALRNIKTKAQTKDKYGATGLKKGANKITSKLFRKQL